jgi:hypothetical protein
MTDGLRRVLHFHTGTWKTGSTALQIFLDRNRPALAEAGVSYEFQPQADHNAGNGSHLRGRLLGLHLAPPLLAGMLEDHFAGRNSAICSSEGFTQFGASEWQQLIDVCGHLHIDIRVITYVRDIAPYYLSLHAQLFKSGEHHATIEEYSNIDCYRPVMNSLRCMHDMLGRSVMTVLHYESTMDRLEAPFLGALGIQAAGFDLSVLSQQLNRSLSQYEMDILRDLIEKTGVQLASNLAALLLERRPALKADRTADAALRQKLATRHAADRAWLNDVFFGGADIVKIDGTTAQAGRHDGLSASDRQAIDRDVANWCISQLGNAQEAGATFIANSLTHIDWKNIGHPALPADFDPIAYLLLNLDVLKSGARPCEHYLAHGRHNHARKWKW